MRRGPGHRARTGDPHVGKEMRGLISLSFFAQTDQIGSFRSIVGEAPEAGIESAKLAGVEPRAYLREATMRPVRNPGTVTLARDLKSPEV
jgi:hypothetical protein